MNYLSKEDLKKINREIIQKTGGTYGAVNEANLHHVCERVKTIGGGTTAKAAYCLHALAYSAHAFTDGNKRTALIACTTFLEANGFELSVSEEELVGVALTIASGSLSPAETRKWLEERIKRT